jgi:hypothetical protein
MRQLILLAMFLIAALPAGASVTVAQLEQILSKDSATHKADVEVVRQIRPLELSERLTEASLNRLTAHLVLGPQTLQALQLVADQSAFLNPPASEIPAIVPPSDTTQRRMLDAARSYVAQTLARLPNFLATRTTNRFDDSPQALTKNAWPVRAGMHFVGTSSGEISVRNDRDTLSSTASAKAPPEQAQSGLTSWGEFGPMLTMIMADTANGKVSWSHWEQAAGGPVAVFHYSVPRTFSHYVVSGSLPQHSFVENSATLPGGFGLKPGLGVSMAALFRIAPGYHGSLWLDPATGTVLRISIEADLKDRDPVKRAEALVQYGPIQIDGRSFICPVRSLTVRMDPIAPNDTSGAAPLLMLNETLFTNYHRFASTARVLTDSPSQ